MIGLKPGSYIDQIKRCLIEETEKCVNKFASYHEVFENCYLGSCDLSKDKEQLKRLNIIGIVNAAQGKDFNQVDTSEDYYRDLNIKYMGFKLDDEEDVWIGQYFEKAAKFIHENINDPSRPGNIFIHCHQGVSRSASLVLAYLMIYKNMSLKQAIQQVASKRYIFPNDGFLEQLIDLEKELYKKK